ncbi:MAG: DNA replication/repair protein RecF [bacterium]
MILQAIEYEGFRNLVDGHLDFDPNFNLITGENGAGKTNLLEAIFFTAYGVSFRTNNEKNILKFNQPYLRVTGTSDAYIGSIFYNGVKKYVLNGNEKNRASDYVGWLPLITMSLNDIWIIRGAPAQRRNFLDWLLIKLNPAYGANLSEYRKVLRQRNCFLQQKDREKDISLLDVYNEQLIMWGNAIYEERCKIFPVLKEGIKQKGTDMGLHKISVEYRSSCPDMKLSLEQIKRNENLEIRRGETIIGPHRDDLYITIDGNPARNFASEGECRLIALILKLTESEILRQGINDQPIFLLDEITIELDAKHRQSFFDSLKGQVFYATIQDPSDFKISNKTTFIVQRGQIALSSAN